MTEMTVAPPATDLDPFHAIRAITQGGDVVGVERFVERRPPGARLELRRGAKERKPAEPAGVDPGLLVAQQAAAERRLRSVIEQHTALLGGEPARQPLALRRRQRIEIVSGLRARAHGRHYMILARRWRAWTIARSEGPDSVSERSASAAATWAVC